MASLTQDSFQKLVRGLRGLDYNILDVKATRWHDDFNSFKSSVKDLEVMLTNVIQLACDVQVGVSWASAALRAGWHHGISAGLPMHAWPGE